MAKKFHHHITVSDFNKCAIDRLMEIGVFEEELLSLRLGGNLRLYGYLVESTYVILWYDNDHGDNNTCVCRSYKNTHKSHFFCKTAFSLCYLQLFVQ